MSVRKLLLVGCLSLSLLRFCGGGVSAIDKEQLSDLIRDLLGSERESAEAKRVRLDWITHERVRIDKERQDLVKEREALSEVLPDPIKPRFVPPAAAKAEVRAKLQANRWVINNDQASMAAIMKGEGLNALLRVFGPLAHYRRLRAQANATSAVFPSLNNDNKITADEAHHYRMSPATSAGSKVITRLNEMPLELEWPTIVLQHWRSDTQSLNKVRNEYVGLLSSAASRDQTPRFQETAESFDKAIENLMAKINSKRSATPGDPTMTDAGKKTQIHRDLLDAIRYLETVRATAERFKSTPSDFKVRSFPGGTVEEFLDFAYTHGMIFGESRRADEEHYLKLVRRMQDYAKDIQSLEDWKSDLEKRIEDLNDTDKTLLRRASQQ